MRDALIIGALYAALGAVVAALAVKFAAPSTLYGISCCGAASRWHLGVLRRFGCPLHIKRLGGRSCYRQLVSA